jgi:hypothetical protein
MKKIQNEMNAETEMAINDATKINRSAQPEQEEAIKPGETVFGRVSRSVSGIFGKRGGSKKKRKGSAKKSTRRHKKKSGKKGKSNKKRRHTRR